MVSLRIEHGLCFMIELCNDKSRSLWLPALIRCFLFVQFADWIVQCTIFLHVGEQGQQIVERWTHTAYSLKLHTNREGGVGLWRDSRLCGSH